MWKADERSIRIVMEDGYIFGIFQISEDMIGEYTSAKKWFIPFGVDLTSVILNWIEKGELPK